MLKPTIVFISTLSLAGCLADEPDTPIISATRDVVITGTTDIPFCRAQVSIRYLSGPTRPTVRARGSYGAVAYPLLPSGDGITYQAFFPTSPSVHIEFDIGPEDEIEGTWGHPIGNLTVSSDRDHWNWDEAFKSGALKCNSLHCDGIDPWTHLELFPCPQPI